MWNELQIALPQGVQYSADTFRAWAASRLGQVLPSALFHYQDAACPLPNRPDIRFVAGKQWVGLRGFGNEAEALIASHGHALTQALCAQHQVAALEERWRSGTCDANRARFPIKYRIHSLAPCRHPGDALREASKAGLLNDPRLLEAASHAIVLGLQQQATRLGVDLPAVEIQGLSIGRSLAVPVKTRWQMLFARVEFSMRVELTGPWQVGSLQARGMGELRRVRA